MCIRDRLDISGYPAGPGHVEVGLHPDDDIGQLGQAASRGADTFDDEQWAGHWHGHGTLAAPRVPGRWSEADRPAGSPRLDDLVDQEVIPVDGVVLPGEVVGADHGGAGAGGQPGGKGRLPAAAAAIDEDEA